MASGRRYWTKLGVRLSSPPYINDSAGAQTGERGTLPKIMTLGRSPIGCRCVGNDRASRRGVESLERKVWDKIWDCK